MEECPPSKPTKLSSFKSRFQAHAAIARSLSPFCARTMRLDLSTSSSSPSSGSSTALQSLIAASGCMCSSTASAVVEAQVPARGLQPDGGCHTPHSAARGDLNGKQAPTPASQKQILQKRGFASPFNRGYARVSDVYSSTHREAPMRHSVKSRGRAQHKSPTGEDHYRIGHGKPKSIALDNSCATKFMQSYQPIVKYTCDPSKAFYESMMETVLCLDRHDFLYLEDMFACYVVLNQPQHWLHIEQAFKLVLTELYRMNGFDAV